MRLRILTSPPGAGKNTISEALAKITKKLAVIDVDVVRWMIRQPHKAPWEGEEGKAQQILGVENASMLAKRFVMEGYDVVILDVLSDETAQLYKKELKGLDPKIILLLPTFDEIQKRNAGRPPRLTTEEIERLFKQQEAFTLFNRKIDNSNLGAEEVARMIFDQ